MEKRRCLCILFCSFLGLPLTATIASISLDASPYHQLGWAEPYCKNAFVRLRRLMIWYSITVSSKTTDPTAVSANPTIDYSKTTSSRRHEQSLPPIMKNERNKPNNPTETQAITARTQIAKSNSELGIIDLHRIPESEIPVNRGSSHAPPQRIPRVDEVESRGWGRRAPQSPSSSSFGAPQGNNEIYTYDVVFSPGEARKKIQSKTQLPYNAPAGNPHW